MTERYRLAPVRDLRDRAERTEKGKLAAAVSEARATEAQVAEAAARVEAARNALAAATATAGGTALAIARAEQFAVRKRRELALARDEHDRALASHRGQLAAVDAARSTLARARADREIIERHFARWRAERAKLADRRSD